MKILVLNNDILAVDPQDAGDTFATADQIIPKHLIDGCELIEVDALPADYAPGRYDYVDKFVLSASALDAIAAAQAIADTEYQRLRAAEYPPITDYLDGIVKGDAEQVQAYINACLAVKTKYPKPDAP